MPLPEGYTKDIEREVVNHYVIPSYFPIKEEQRVAMEVLDEIFAISLGVHILEP